MTKKIIVTADKLQLADRVYDAERPEFGLMTVSQIREDGAVKFHRPYTHTGDFSYTGGVICYTGLEEFYDERFITDYVVVARKTLR